MINKNQSIGLGSYALLLAVFLIDFASAQLGFGGSMGNARTPLDLLIYNESAHIVLLFFIFFGLIFFAIKNVFKGERGIAILIAFALSLLIIYALAQGGFLQTYFEQELAIWALVIAAVVGFSFLLKLIYEEYGKWVTAIVLIAVYIGIFYLDISYFIPYSTVNDILTRVQEFLVSWWGISLFTIIILFILIKKEGNTLASYLKKIKLG